MAKRENGKDPGSVQMDSAFPSFPLQENSPTLPQQMSA